ncbi:MAG TPA: sulfotransferase [Gaiellaceae bacterium]
MTIQPVDQFDQPIFVLCCGRTGSTLLRMVLDAHPDLFCPCEVNISTIFGDIARFMGPIMGNTQSTRRDELVRLCRTVTNETIGKEALRQGKRRWAEKSLDAVGYTNLLREIFPSCTFVGLVRECSDTVASLIEASPHGFRAYGLGQFVAQNPANVIAAAASLWLDRTSRVLDALSGWPEASCLIKYEDIVTQPQAALNELFEFLGLAPVDVKAVRTEIFDRDKGSPRGDYKIWDTTDFEVSSVGRGRSLPLEEIPAPLTDRINAIHNRLGYPPLGARPGSTNTTGVAKHGARRRDAHKNGAAYRRLEDLMNGRVSERSLETMPLIVGGRRRNRFVVNLLDDPHPWKIELASGVVDRMRTSRRPSLYLTSDSTTLLELANGSIRPGLAIRQGRVRLAGDCTWIDTDDRSKYVRAFVSLVVP